MKVNFFSEFLKWEYASFIKGFSSDFLSSPFRVKGNEHYAYKIINCSWFCKCSLCFQWQKEVSKRSIIFEHVRVEPFRMLGDRSRRIPTGQRVASKEEDEIGISTLSNVFLLSFSLSLFFLFCNVLSFFFFFFRMK